MIPAFGFGDVKTRHRSVFPLKPEVGLAIPYIFYIFGHLITISYVSVHLNKSFRQLIGIPVSILHKSIVDRYRPVRVTDGPRTARCRFIKNASWDV